MLTTFLLIVIFAAPVTGSSNPHIGTVAHLEFPTQAGCLNVLEVAFKQPDAVKHQIINAGCYPLK